MAYPHQKKHSYLVLTSPYPRKKKHTYLQNKIQERPIISNKKVYIINDANLISKVYNVSKSAMPLKSYNDLSSFKIYMMDVGLLRQMSKLDSKIIAEGNRLFEEFKGAFTENFILNQLNIVYNTVPNYFNFDRYEIDFLIQTKNKIFPIEVKSGKSNKNTSLSKYNEIFENECGIRFSTNNLIKDGKILNIPIFMVEYIDKLLDLMC